MDLEGRMSLELQERLKGACHKYSPHILTGFVVLLLVHDVFGNHGFLAMQKKQQEIQRVNAELDRLNKENAALDQDVKDLKTDPQTIKKIAREELGLAKPGEIIIKLPPPVLNDSSAPAAKP
jgi:cell division protein FtsL